MLSQTVFIGEPVEFHRDNDKFTVCLNHWSGHIAMPVTQAQARALVTAAQQQGQIAEHRPTRAGRSSCRFRPGNQLAAVMNEEGNPDTLLSLVPYNNDTWLAWVAGDGATFHIIPNDVAHRILKSARSQAGRTQPTLIHHGRSRYIFIQPNQFAAILQPKTETEPHGRLNIEDATTNQLHQRFTATWRSTAV